MYLKQYNITYLYKKFYFLDKDTQYSLLNSGPNFDNS